MSQPGRGFFIGGGATITITLNGEPCTLEEPLTVAALLDRLELHPRTVAVELNYDILKRDRYAATTLADGDRVEVVRMIGGGSDSCGRRR